MRAVASLLVLSACVVDEVSIIEHDLDREVVEVCSDGEYRCLAKLVVADELRAAPRGLGANDLVEAYRIPTAGDDAPTIAIVVAFGHTALDAELASYRTRYALPPCTLANGCLRVVNQRGDASPLPPNPPATSDWTLETMLDVEMASAACPRCRLLVVQADDAATGLLVAQRTAVVLGADVVSNSWGRAETAGQSLAAAEAYFDHHGIATFVAAGDTGFNNRGEGPSYPGTSRHVIAVGGTRLVRAATARGWNETAWSDGGSGCSLSIAKPSHQADAPCAFRASSDVSAVGDPATGVAVYHAGAWKIVGGTSAAAPLVAGIFAAAGQGHQTAASIARQADRFFDVTQGSNGGCASALCDAGAGWDGPTGIGTPDGAALAEADLLVEPEPEPELPADDPGLPRPDDPVAGCQASGHTTPIVALLLLALRRRRSS